MREVKIGVKKDVRIRIREDLQHLTQEEHDVLAALLLKVGFKDVGISGGVLDFAIDIQGPEILATLEDVHDVVGA